MKKQRKYLSDLLKIDIHHVVNSVGYWDRQIGNHHISLQPEQFGERQFLQLFVNNQRVDKQWELSFRYHRGWLQNNGRIPHDCSEVWYVVGANGKRYQFLYIDLETCRIGTRDDHFPTGNSQQYRRKDHKGEMSWNEQVKAKDKQLWPEDDEFTGEYKRREKLSRFLNGHQE